MVRLFLAVYIQSDESTISYDVLEKDAYWLYIIGIFAVHVLLGLVVCVYYWHSATIRKTSFSVTNGSISLEQS
jgi:hypothetical protein